MVFNESEGGPKGFAKFLQFKFRCLEICLNRLICVSAKPNTLIEEFGDIIVVLCFFLMKWAGFGHVFEQLLHGRLDMRAINEDIKVTKLQ
jgi:hypothetical protein